MATKRAGGNFSYLKVATPGKHKNFRSWIRKKSILLNATQGDFMVLAIKFREILQRYMRNQGSVKMKRLSKSTRERRIRLGFGTKPLYERGEFYKATGEIDVKSSGVLFEVSTGPLLDSIFETKRKNKSTITYRQLRDWIVYGHSRIIPERNIFDPAVQEWEKEVYRPFIARFIKNMRRA